MASTSIAVEGTDHWAVDLLVEIIAGSVPLKLPKPVIRAGVRAIVSTVSDVDPAVVGAILARLNAPLSLASEVWETFSARAGEDEDGEEETDNEDSVEVECPESSDTIVLEAGDGFYTCPDCGQDIEVDEGIGYHPFLVDCPSTGESFFVKAEEDEYECPECSGTVMVIDDSAVHAPVRGRRWPKKK